MLVGLKQTHFVTTNYFDELVVTPDGNPVNMAAKSADVLRHQADGTWRFVIDNPWGTD